MRSGPPPSGWAAVRHRLHLHRIGSHGRQETQCCRGRDAALPPTSFPHRGFPLLQGDTHRRVQAPSRIAHQMAHVCPDSQAPTDVRTQGPYVCTAAAAHIAQSTGGVARTPVNKGEVLDAHRYLREGGGDAAACILIQPPSAETARRIQGDHLTHFTHQGAHHPLDRGPGDAPRIRATQHAPRGILRIGLLPQYQFEPIGLGRDLQVRRESCGRADTQREHTGRGRVQRPGMADAQPGTQTPPHCLHHLVRRRARRFEEG